jgi:hypothetical protein
VFEAGVPYVCALKARGVGWYEVHLTPALVERPGGRFVADACEPQPLAGGL